MFIRRPLFLNLSIHARALLFIAVCTSQSIDAQSPCHNLSTDAYLTYECNQQHSTIELSRSVSATMLPMAAALPFVLYGSGLAASDKYLAETGVGLLISNAAALGTAYVAKLAFGRPRPWRSHGTCITAFEEDEQYSFPSGHATGTTVMATYLSLRYPHWYVIAPSCAYTLYTWYARMNLGVHYPSDILGGALIGALVGYGVYALRSELSNALSPIVPLVGTPGDDRGTTIHFRIQL